MNEIMALQTQKSCKIHKLTSFCTLTTKTYYLSSLYHKEKPYIVSGNLKPDNELLQESEKKKL